MPREINNERFPDRLPGQTAACPPCQYRDAELNGRFDCGMHVFPISRDEYGVRLNLINARVRTINIRLKSSVRKSPETFF